MKELVFELIGGKRQSIRLNDSYTKEDADDMLNADVEHYTLQTSSGAVFIPKKSVVLVELNYVHIAPDLGSQQRR